MGTKWSWDSRQISGNIVPSNGNVRRRTIKLARASGRVSSGSCLSSFPSLGGIKSDNRETGSDHFLPSLFPFGSRHLRECLSYFSLGFDELHELLTEEKSVLWALLYSSRRKANRDLELVIETGSKSRAIECAPY